MTSDRTISHLLRSALLIEETLRKRLVPIGIKPAQAHLLDAIDRSIDPTPVSLAQAAESGLSDMVGVIEQLRSAGWVERVAPSRLPPEQTKIKLTPKGRMSLAEARGIWRQMEKQLITTLDEDEADGLRHVLPKLVIGLAGTRPSRASLD